MPLPVLAYPRAYQANALVRAPLRLTHTEARLFALALGCVHQGQTELPGIVIPLSRVLRQKKGGSVYETVREACKGLMSKVVTIESRVGTKKRFVAYSLISYMELNEGTGLLTGNFAPEIKPLLLQLAEHYTHVEIETLLTLRSAHTHRLYWLLKSWDDVGQWEVSFADLRRQVLGPDNDVTYLLFYDFKRYVLEPSLRELHGLGWAVAYEVRKAGNRVQGLCFTIPAPAARPREAGKRPPAAPPLLVAEPLAWQQRVATRLHKLRLTPTQIRHVLDYLGAEETRGTRLMQLTHPLLRDFEAGNKVFDNLGGTAVNLLKGEFWGLFAPGRPEAGAG